jgi:hypothetical protein
VEALQTDDEELISLDRISMVTFETACKQYSKTVPGATDVYG